MKRIVETALSAPRIPKTLRSARRFNASTVFPPPSSGEGSFLMRSVMDLDPRLGKWISHRAVQVNDPFARNIGDPASSRFVDAGEIDAAVAGIRRDGFYVFRKVADPTLVHAIRSFAEQAPAQGRGSGAPPTPYPRESPQLGRYDIAEEVALRSPEVQEFVTDPAMALIAQRYLGQPVLMDEVAFWWTTSKKAEDANLNAQQFHQDRDRLSFLKFFIYLTDVTPETGPHVYIRGSHRKIPFALRADGRKTDEAVKRAGLWDEVQEICGPAGTLMAVDTIGLHKGKTPLTGDRLALENEFATSLFGAEYEIPAFVPTDLMRRRYAEMPWVLQRYAKSITSG